MAEEKKKELTKRQLKAIELLVEGELSLEKIADDPEVKISLRQFHRWRYENEEFKAKWRELAEFYESSTLSEMKMRIPEIVKEHLKIAKQDKDLTSKMRAIQSWEDRCMGTPTKKIEAVNTNGTNQEQSTLDDEIDNLVIDDEEFKDIE